MFTHAVAVMASAWLVSAQISTENSAFHPHATFAFIRTGERTPLEQPGASVLTALGANQMYDLGRNFRSRYVSGNSPAALGVAHIANISQDFLNNDQILVQTLDTPYLISSAQAFMQGLYPAHGISNGTGDATGVLADGTVLDFPLNGYQYADIESFGSSDPNSISVSGSQNCPIAQRDAMRYFTTDTFINAKSANEELYNSLPEDWFGGNINKDEIDFVNALNVAEYLSYQYNHNSTVYTLLTNDSNYDGVYDKVRHLADEQAWYLYGNTSTVSNSTSNQAIAGKTLASSILGQFQKLIMDRTSSGSTTDLSYPLTLYFGDQEPIISLISLIMADYHNTYFQSLPEYSSALIFELFSTGDHVSFPTSQDDLWVRFSFHNGTGYENNQLMSFPVFGNGPSNTDMQWSEFQARMAGITMNSLVDWCETCNSASIFCVGVNNADITIVLPASQRKGNVSPTVAGVIGAIVTLVVAALLVALAMLLGGLRMHRVAHRSTKIANAHLGGFKGSRKLASDPDLSLTKHGAPVAGIVTSSFGTGGDRHADADSRNKRGHERVGSWELRQKEVGGDAGVGGESSPRQSFDAIDAVAGGARPVEPFERV